ncbi:MAG: DUF3089 domain-containing protein [Alphaproteobacteria bacterium]|nr:DUF3089 domain-containing protein [Alphaproteobacteria bacterium]
MAKIFLWIIAGIITLVIIGAIVISQFGEKIFIWSVTPPHPLSEEQMPPAPDYALDQSWAALPGKKDPTDVTPGGPGLTDNQANADVDVFYVHPTTHITRDSWIAPIDGPERTMEFLNGFVLPNQASAFNGCCRVFAPHYRQATVGSFFAPAQPDGLKALDFAYGDVKRAWRNFIESRSEGRPFILASHSQGSLHAIRLLMDEIAGSPAAERMVAAYIVGYAVPMKLFEAELSALKPCTDETETGCVMSWQSFVEGGNPEDVAAASGFGLPGYEVGEASLPMLCTNPLTGTQTQEPKSAAFHAGGFDFEADQDRLPRPIPAFAGAYCRDGILWVSLEDPEAFDRFRTPDGNLHAYDYNLFYIDIRQDAMRRASQFLGQ